MTGIETLAVVLAALSWTVLLHYLVSGRRAKRDNASLEVAADGLKAVSGEASKLVDAAAKLTKEQTAQTKEFLSVLREEHDQNLKIHLAVSQRLVEAHGVLQAQGVLRKSGLDMYLQDPDARVNQEVQAWMARLGCDRPTAIRAIVNAVKVTDTDE